VTDDRRLWNWLQDWIDGEATPRTVRVFLLDEAGDRARGWRCRAATPVRWTGPALAADRPGVATEALAVAHEGIDAVDGRG
jgi:phage tail-like protein